MLNFNVNTVFFLDLSLHESRDEGILFKIFDLSDRRLPDLCSTLK